MKNIALNKLVYHIKNTNWDVNSKIIFNHNNKEPQPENILIIQLSSIGDTIYATPVFEGIRKKYPQAKIVLLIEKHCKQIVEYNKNINEIIFYDRFALVEELKIDRQKVIGKLESIIEKLRTYKFDLCINMHTSPRSAYWAYFSNSESYMGMYANDNQNCVVAGDAWVIYKYQYYSQPVNNNFKIFVNPIALQYKIFVGSWLSELKYQIGYTDHEKQKVEKFWTLYNLSDYKDKVISINTGSNALNRQWILKYWVELINELQESGYKPFFIGGPKDQLRIKHIQKKLPKNIPNIFEIGNSLIVDTYALKKSDYLISVDTCAIHMASAVDTPCLVLIGPGYLPPISKNSLVVFSENSKCRNCQNPYCNVKGSEHHECMKKLKPDDVFKAFKILTNIQIKPELLSKLSKNLYDESKTKILCTGNKKISNYTILRQTEFPYNYSAEIDYEFLIGRIITLNWFEYFNNKPDYDINKTEIFVVNYLENIPLEKNKFNKMMQNTIFELSELSNIVNQYFQTMEEDERTFIDKKNIIEFERSFKSNKFSKFFELFYCFEFSIFKTNNVISITKLKKYFRTRIEFCEVNIKFLKNLMIL